MASPVIAAAVGRGTPFKDLYPPVVIELELFENEDDTVSVFRFLATFTTDVFVPVAHGGFSELCLLGLQLQQLGDRRL